jgi:threonine aldolase
MVVGNSDACVELRVVCCGKAQRILTATVVAARAEPPETPVIDLRSDTCSRPTADMRAVMANAEVGDDVYGDDPSVKALERATAELLGKEDAVYMPTGTMTNQVGLRAHTQPGDAVLFDQNAHVYMLEGGAPAALSGVLPRLLPGVRGIFTAADVDAAVGRLHPYLPSTIAAPVKLLCLENTHNVGGGAVWPIAQLNAVAATARRHGLALHLDGARLWHATAASGVSEADYAAPFDSISVCFSKALGAPVGSCLVGSKDFVTRARRFKQQFGGGFRQAGMIAAGALFALTHHRQRLAETHQMAQRFAQGLAQLERIVIDPVTVETNIVRFQLNDVDAASFVEEAHRRGVHMLPSGAHAVRAVFYLDIKPAEVERAVAVISEALRALPVSAA